MIFLETSELTPGMVMARDVPNPSRPHMTLLRRGHKLTGKTIRALSRYPIEGVWVKDEDLVYLEALLPEEIDKVLQELAIQSFALWSALERDPDAILPAKPFEVMVDTCLSLLNRIELRFFPWRPVYSGDVFFGVHGAYVMLLSLVIARGLEEYIEREYPADAPVRRIDTLLGLSALLHDTGNLKVPKHILYEPGELTGNQLEEVRRHPGYGYLMLHEAMGAHVALVALHHHQRYDGTGYPERRYSHDEEARPLAGHRIPVLARIVAAADLFVTLISERPYSGAFSHKAAWEEVRSLSGSALDAVIAERLCAIVPPYPPGRRAKLTNGCYAVVTGMNEAAPLSPPLRTVQAPDGTWLPTNRREDIVPSLTGIRIVEESPAGLNEE